MADKLALLVSSLLRVIRHSDGAGRAFYRLAAINTAYKSIVSAAVEEQYRLLSARVGLDKRLRQFVSDGRDVARVSLLTHIGDSYVGQARAAEAPLPLLQRLEDAVV